MPIRRVLLAVAVACAGCSYPNVALNDNRVVLENRVRNHTRAATFTAISVPNSQSLKQQPALAPEISPTRSQATAERPQLADDDGYFVGLSISGGGSRSANFGAACMFQLQRIGLLQKVDYISSVSGGSVVAAYYCLNHEDWNPETAQKKLTHAFATDMLIQTLLPWNWVALLFTDYDRSDLLAKTLNDNLYTHRGRQQTYADLLPDRPRLLINATDLQSGRRFVFCNETFDRMNSDLSKLPIAYAVAASSSVPVVLHDVTLRDFSTAFKQYRHLVDGGVSDNLGVTSLVETYNAQTRAAARMGLPNPYPNGAIYIVIDARVEYDRDISSKSDTGIIDAVATSAGLLGASLLNRASSATLDDVILRNAPDKSTAKGIRDAIEKLEKEGYVDLENVDGQHVRVAHLALSQLEGVSQLPFRSFQEAVNSTSTYFNIDEQKAAQLYIAADLLMRDRFEPTFRQLLHEMNEATTRPTTEPATR